jgi:hypothetical protein
MLTNSVTVTANALETGFNPSVATHGLFLVQPLFFMNATFFSNQQFYMPFAGLAGKSYVLQASTNFSNWISLDTNLAPSDTFNFLDPSASNFPARFYRAFQLP